MSKFASRYGLAAKTAVGFAAALVLAACGMQGPQGIPATDAHRALFPGQYSTTVSGGDVVTLIVSPALEYEYEQPMEAKRMRKMKGELMVTGDRTARAGRVQLDWASRNTVDVKSPYGTDMQSGGAGGDVQGTWGREYRLRRQ